MNEDIKNMFLTEETDTIVKRFMRGDFADYELADAFCDIIERIDDKSVLISLLTPVTPNDETKYIKPSDLLAILLIRSKDVGAIIEITT